MTDPMPMMTLFDKQIAIRMGQANVRRWVDDILPLLTDDDPLGVETFATHHLPLNDASGRLRDVPGQARRSRQDRVPARTGLTRMRVVVIGATGNVGTALLDALAPIPEVRRARGRTTHRRMDRAPAGKLPWHAADIASDPLDFVAGADAVVHLAWLIQPSRRRTEMRRRT